MSCRQIEFSFLLHTAAPTVRGVDAAALQRWVLLGVERAQRVEPRQDHARGVAAHNIYPCETANFETRISHIRCQGLKPRRFQALWVN